MSVGRALSAPRDDGFMPCSITPMSRLPLGGPDKVKEELSQAWALRGPRLPAVIKSARRFLKKWGESEQEMGNWSAECCCDAKKKVHLALVASSDALLVWLILWKWKALIVFPPENQTIKPQNSPHSSKHEEDFITCEYLCIYTKQFQSALLSVKLHYTSKIFTGSILCHMTLLLVLLTAFPVKTSPVEPQPVPLWIKYSCHVLSSEFTFISFAMTVQTTPSVLPHILAELRRVFFIFYFMAVDRIWTGRPAVHGQEQ